MTELEFICKTEEEQIELGRMMAEFVSYPLLVFLNGDLGTGKSTLARAVIQSSGFDGAVRSPTYTLMEPYDLGGKVIYHLDLYRLADGEELEYLGLREILDQKDSLLFIEWSENGKGWLPDAGLIIEIQHLPEGRKLIFKSDNRNGMILMAGLKAALT